MGTAEIEHVSLDIKKLKGKARRVAEEKFEEKKVELNPQTVKLEISELKNIEYTTKFEPEILTYTTDGVETYDKFCDGT